MQFSIQLFTEPNFLEPTFYVSIYIFLRLNPTVHPWLAWNSFCRLLNSQRSM